MKTLLAGAIMLLIGGCATYTENGLFGGYTETPLAANTWRIEGKGNELTSRRKTNAIALTRAAELAQEHGYSRFVIANYNEWSKTLSYQLPGSSYTSFHVSPYGYGSAFTTYTPGATVNEEHPRTDVVVVFIADDDPQAGNALLVADILSKYGPIAGFKPKFNETPAATLSVSNKALKTQAPTPFTQAADHVSSPASKMTLDQLYRMLPRKEKAKVDAMPPAERATYLEAIRDGS